MHSASTFALPLFLLPAALAQGPALTIYNQGFAVVRDRVALDLKQGANDVQFVGVTTHLEPDSVVLRDPAGKLQLKILEQNFRSDTISQGLLLSRFEGKEIEFITVDRDGKEHTVRGKVIRSGYQPTYTAMPRYGQQYAGMQSNWNEAPSSPIVEVEGKLRFSLPGQPIFPALDDDSILMPTLQWKLFAAEASKLDAEVSYVTAGMSWEASYNLVAPEKSDTMDLVGWITMDNQSGKVFTDATIKLMAGDVNKVQPPGPGSPVMDLSSFAAGAGPRAPQVTEKAFDEFHLYSLPLATTLRNRQQKQVEFVHATNVAAKTIYVYNGASLGNYAGWDWLQARTNPDYGVQSNGKVWVMREFMNSEKNGLGLPLPKGRVRFYRRDDADGRLEFTGENNIDHTPKDEKVRIYTGDSFDLVGERKRTDYQVDSGRRQSEEAFEIHVRNKKDAAVEVRVFEHLYRWSNWEVLSKSHEFSKLDSNSIEFTVSVPPSGETVVTYRVRYTW